MASSIFALSKVYLSCSLKYNILSHMVACNILYTNKSSFYNEINVINVKQWVLLVIWHHTSSRLIFVQSLRKVIYLLKHISRLQVYLRCSLKYVDHQSLIAIISTSRPGRNKWRPVLESTIVSLSKNVHVNIFLPTLKNKRQFIKLVKWCSKSHF